MFGMIYITSLAPSFRVLYLTLALEALKKWDGGRAPRGRGLGRGLVMEVRRYYSGFFLKTVCADLRYAHTVFKKIWGVSSPQFGAFLATSATENVQVSV